MRGTIDATRIPSSPAMVIAQVIKDGKREDDMAQQANNLSHTKWMRKYHIVFAPKYRRKIIYNQYRESGGDPAEALLVQKRRDHRGASDAGPCAYAGGHTAQDERVELHGVSGGKSSLMMFEKHGNLKYKFGNLKLWREDYCASTVGLNEATIAKCIREQEAHDKALDRLGVKEYEGPLAR